MNIFGPGKEHCNQLLFRDDRKAVYRKLPVEHGLVQERQNESVINAWPMPYSVLKRYEGGNGLPKGMYLLSFNRDIILDPFKQLKDEEKPEKGKTLVKDAISEMATSTVYRHSLGGKKSIMDKLTVGVIVVMILFGLWIGLAVALNGG